MIDLIQEEFKVTNPILIAELIEEHFETEVSIFEIINHLEEIEDYEKISRKIEYNL